MGLRLLAHFHDRNEAIIVRSVLDAAGVAAFAENIEQNSNQPFHQIALGGFRIMVCDEDLDTALAVIEEARRKRSFEGERLSQRTYLALSQMLLLLTGVFLPFRSSTWHDVKSARGAS